MLDAKTIKFGGWVFILSSLFYILTFITSGNSRILYGVFGLEGTVLLAPAIWGLYLYYRRSSESYLVRLGTMALVVGAFFIVWLYGTALVAGLAAQDMGELSAEIEIMGTTVSGVGIMFGNILFLGTFLLALTSVRDEVDPKWLGWLGMIGSLVTIPWFFFVWAPPMLQIIPAFGFALVIIWMIVMGVRMARSA
jgi:hypothetical protein